MHILGGWAAFLFWGLRYIRQVPVIDRIFSSSFPTHTTHHNNISQTDSKMLWSRLITLCKFAFSLVHSQSHLGPWFFLQPLRLPRLPAGKVSSLCMVQSDGESETKEEPKTPNKKKTKNIKSWPPFPLRLLPGHPMYCTWYLECKGDEEDSRIVVSLLLQVSAVVLVRCATGLRGGSHKMVRTWLGPTDGGREPFEAQILFESPKSKKPC